MTMDAWALAPEAEAGKAKTLTQAARELIDTFRQRGWHNSWIRELEMSLFDDAATPRYTEEEIGNAVGEAIPETYHGYPHEVTETTRAVLCKLRQAREDR